MFIPSRKYIGFPIPISNGAEVRDSIFKIANRENVHLRTHCDEYVYDHAVKVSSTSVDICSSESGYYRQINVHIRTHRLLLRVQEQSLSRC